MAGKCLIPVLHPAQSSNHSVKRKAAAVDVECVYWNRGRVCVGGHGGDSVSPASAQSAGLKGAPLKEVSVLSDPECSMNYILVLT